MKEREARLWNRTTATERVATRHHARAGVMAAFRRLCLRASHDGVRRSLCSVGASGAANSPGTHPSRLTTRRFTPSARSTAL